MDRVHEEAHVLVLGHLRQEVAVGAVEPLDDVARLEEGGDPHVDRRLHRRVAARLAERRLELHLGRHQLELHLEPRHQLVLGDVRRVDLLAHDRERVGDGAREAVDDDVVDELDVDTPRRRALGDLELAVGREQQLVDLLAALVDLGVPLLQVRRLLGGELGGVVRLRALALDERVARPVGQDGLDRAHVVLEHRQLAVALPHERHRVADEVVDRVRLPRQVLEPLGERLVDGLEVGGEQRPLDVEHREEHLVVHARHQLQVAHLHAEGLVLLAELGGRLRDVLVEHLEVGDLAQQPHERRVEVDVQQQRLVVARQQRLLELRLRDLLDARAPRLVLRRLEVAQPREQARVRLRDVLGLLGLEHEAHRRLELRHRALDALDQAAHPEERARHRRHVDVERRPLALEVLARRRRGALPVEDLGDVLEVGGVRAEQVGLAPLEVGLDELALEQPLERLDQLERREDGRAVLEALVEHRAEAALELLDRRAEAVKVVVELLHVDVEDVVRQVEDDVEQPVEVGVDLHDRRRERAPLVAADLDLLELAELHDRAEEVEQVVAALEEGVEPREERGVLDLPRVVGHLGRARRLEVEVRRLEEAAHLERQREALERLRRVELKDLLRIEEAACRGDQLVAHLAHQNDQPRRRVVVRRVLPHEQQPHHDRPEEVGQLGEGAVLLLLELREGLAERLEELGVVGGLGARRVDLLAQPREGGEVRALGQVEDAHDLADLVALQLLLNRAQVVALRRPEVDLGERPRVLGRLEDLRARVWVEWGRVGWCRVVGRAGALAWVAVGLRSHTTGCCVCGIGAPARARSSARS